jgi:8-oxo-dGTP pyrophosphatase MutT (NUDIX family)
MPLRKRATGVVVKDGKVLLVRDKGRRSYSLPGSSTHRDEPAISAVARELYEETGLSADRVERVMTYRGATQEHAVFLISAHHGRLRLRGELDGSMWWDGKANVPTFDHVIGILKRLKITDGPVVERGGGHPEAKDAP